MANLHPILISCAEDSQAFAASEIAILFPQLPVSEWLVGNPGMASGVGLVKSPVAFAAFSRKIETGGSIFIRHIAPATVEIPLQNDETDLPRLEEAIRALLPQMDPTQTISVQSRLLGDTFRPFDRSKLNQALYAVIQEAIDAPLDARLPEQVVSVTLALDRAFLGVSMAAQNRSLWPGGQMRFRREEGQISRAEFKLLEAISVFDLTLPERGTALDIGAAPGGWTNVLRRVGLRVIAVDPAEMHESLRRDRLVVHIKERIQRYRAVESLDIIVNDIKMDARDSIEMLLNQRRRLNRGGLAVMSVKLPKTVPSSRAMLDFVRMDLRRLEAGFTIIGARQLFHNRSEITVALSSG